MSRARHLPPLGLLCACLSAGYRGQGSADGAAAALAEPATDLVRLARLAGPVTAKLCILAISRARRRLSGAEHAAGELLSFAGRADPR